MSKEGESALSHLQTRARKLSSRNESALVFLKKATESEDTSELLLGPMEGRCYVSDDDVVSFLY